jgi:5-methyltetrahydrofolate--homocysteine methyltransferase
VQSNIISLIQENLLQGDSKKVANLVREALEKRIEIENILNDGLIEGMNLVGNRFKANEIFIPEVLIAAQAMQAGIAVLEPY